MSRLLLATIALLVATTACSGGEAAVTDAVAAPDIVVSDWVAAIGDLDMAVLSTVTDPANLALVAGAENSFSVEQMAAIVAQGLPATTRRSYWTTFRESFLAFLGGDASDVVVAGLEEYLVGETRFAAVTLLHQGKESEVITQLGDNGWYVDMLATAGPALAVQIRRLVAGLVAEADDNVAFTYTTTAVRSLNASLARDPDNRSLELEIEAIEDLPIDLSR